MKKKPLLLYFPEIFYFYNLQNTNRDLEKDQPFHCIWQFARKK